MSTRDGTDFSAWKAQFDATTRRIDDDVIGVSPTATASRPCCSRSWTISMAGPSTCHSTSGFGVVEEDG